MKQGLAKLLRENGEMTFETTADKTRNAKDQARRKEWQTPAIEDAEIAGVTAKSADFVESTYAKLNS